MSTHRNMMLGSASAAAAIALALSGAAYASTSAHPTHTTPAHRTVAASPNPNAPHRGFVKGVQRGPSIAINNAKSVHAFKVLHQQMLTGKPAAAQPDGIHTNTGTSFDSSVNFQGSQADQSVSTKIHVADNGTTLYTPTMYPSGGTKGACIEMSTAYNVGSSVVAAWDWCHAITFVASVNIDKAFMKTYTSNKHYSVQIVQTNASSNTWTSYLYNYQTNAWEQFYQQSGTSQISGSTDGWDVYELYSNIKANGQSYACKDLRGKTIDADQIMVDNSGTWALADPTNSGHDYDQPLSSFDCKDITYNIISPNWHFAVTG